MAIANLLYPNNYRLYCGGIQGAQAYFSEGIQGNIIGGDIVYDTLTQNNGNSGIDENGLITGGDLQINGSANITGSLQANFIETANMEVSGEIISTKVTSPEFSGIQFAGVQGRFNNVISNEFSGVQFSGAQGRFDNVIGVQFAGTQGNFQRVITPQITGTQGNITTLISNQGTFNSITSNQFSGVQFAGTQGRFNNVYASNFMKGNVVWADRAFLATSPSGVLELFGNVTTTLTPDQFVNGFINYTNSSSSTATITIPNLSDIVSYLGIAPPYGGAIYFECNFAFDIDGGGYSIAINLADASSPLSPLLFNESKYPVGTYVTLRLVYYMFQAGFSYVVPMIGSYTL
jgi:hypothetical protein